MVSSAILTDLLTDLDNVFARKTHVINYSPPGSSRASLSFKGRSKEIRIYTALIVNLPHLLFTITLQESCNNPFFHG